MAPPARFLNSSLPFLPPPPATPLNTNMSPSHVHAAAPAGAHLALHANITWPHLHAASLLGDATALAAFEAAVRGALVELASLPEANVNIINIREAEVGHASARTARRALLSAAAEQEGSSASEWGEESGELSGSSGEESPWEESSAESSSPSAPQEESSFSEESSSGTYSSHRRLNMRAHA